MSEAYSTLGEISKRFDAEDFAFLANNPYFFFTINSYELFSQHIYNRVKKQNPDKSIDQKADYIIINDKEGDESLYLYPRWRDIGLSIKTDVCEDVNFAIGLIESKQCKHIYLLFPKNEHFRKHIPIKIPHLEAQGIDYSLKLVPYKIH
jgi:hypothetical protein